jgi:hypothetical protein
LDAPDHPLFGERSKGVVHRLQRDRADRGPYGLIDVGSGAVGSVGHSAQNSETLGP